jgi:hypothetical protein
MLACTPMPPVLRLVMVLLVMAPVDEEAMPMPNA